MVTMKNRLQFYCSELILCFMCSFCLFVSSWGQYPNGTMLQCCILGSTVTTTNKTAIIDVSCRKSRLGGMLEEDKLPVAGDNVPAFVMCTNPKGCFLRLSRNAEARVVLKELSVGYVSDPSTFFPPGRLVLGKVKSINTSSKGITGATRVDMDLRETSVADGNLDGGDSKLEFDKIHVGDKYKGTITRIAEYGVFVRLEKSNICGLAHKSECSENFVVDVSSFYDPGDIVKVLVIRKMDEKKQLGLSMKASHFVDDDDEEDESDDEEDAVTTEGVPNDKRPEIVSEEEITQTQLDMDEEKDDDDEGDDDDSDDSSAEEDGEDRDLGNDASSTGKELGLDTNVGFDWNGKTSSNSDSISKGGDDDGSSDDDDSDDIADPDSEENTRDRSSQSRSSRRTQAARRREELATSRREAALADGTADESLETSADFERLLASNPNSSELWIRYMAFHLTLADVAAARRVAEKALARIEFREEQDKMNVWCALLTLEVKYGNDASVDDALARACQQVNPKHIHLRLCEILGKEGSSDAMKKTLQVFTRMTKRFRTKKTMWLAYLRFLLTQERDEDAFALSKRALLSLPKYKHIWLLSHFGMLLFECGKAEQARAVFEALLRENPKRADLLSLFMDQELKHGEIRILRELCTRVAMAGDLSNSADRVMKLSDKQMKNFFKRWFTIEESNGTESDRDAVKAAARRYVEESI